MDQSVIRGVDLKQKKRAGQTPLHTHCPMGVMSRDLEDMGQAGEARQR